MAPRSDLHELLHALLPFAQQTLERYDAFLPFGASMGAAGDIRLVAAAEGPDAPAMLSSLQIGLRAEAAAGAITAAGTCVAVHLELGEAPTDAIAMDLEHGDGDVMRVLVPYSRAPGGGYAFGDAVTTDGERRFF